GRTRARARVARGNGESVGCEHQGVAAQIRGGGRKGESQEHSRRPQSLPVRVDRRVRWLVETEHLFTLRARGSRALCFPVARRPASRSGPDEGYAMRNFDSREAARAWYNAGS